MKLLGDSQSKKEREHIAERLGGHPLAILLYQKGTALPETNEDVQSYVEEVVMSTLDASTRWFRPPCPFPRPIEAKKAYDDDVVGTLDDSAFLRWTSGMEKMELQHLVRNVRRTTMSHEEKLKLHRQAVLHWEECAETPDDQIVLLFHRICSESEDLDSHCGAAVEKLVPLIAAPYRSFSNRRLNFETAFLSALLAAKVALDRCEPKHTHRHLQSIEEEGHFNEIDMGLAYLEGRIEDAEKAIERGLSIGSQHQKNQLALAAASRRLDDRIDATLSKDAVIQIKQYHSNILFQKPLRQRAVTIVALTMVQHALALAEENFVKAETLRATLVSVGGIDDAFVLGLEAKASLVEAKKNPHHLATAIERTQRALAHQSSRFIAIHFA